MANRGDKGRGTAGSRGSIIYGEQVGTDGQGVAECEASVWGRVALCL